MPRLARLSEQEVREARAELDRLLENGMLEIGPAIRRMRSILQMSQAVYAQRFKLSVRQLSELENGRSNPTVETLERLGRPFRMAIGFVRPQSSAGVKRGPA